MAYLTPVAMDLARSEDWSNHTVGELYDALLESTFSTLPDAVQGRMSEEMNAWKNACKPNIDFLLYIYCDPFGIWPAEKSVESCVQEHRSQRLIKSAKRNLFVFYFNVYLYKYISIEINRLENIAAANPGLTFEMAVRHFITTLVYHGIAGQNPGAYLGYDRMDFIPAGRKQNFRSIEQDICRAHRTTDKQLMFKSIFYLMTYFAGSEYRRVHDAVTTLLGVDMANFRELFYKNLPDIIANEGGIKLGGIEPSF